MLRIIFILLAILAFLFSCQEKNQSDGKKLQLGEELAKVQCAKCHAYPDPGLLDKESWREYMLPRMGQMLGMYESEEQRAILIKEQFPSNPEEASEIYPSQALITQENWALIQAYYLTMAPDTIKPIHPNITVGLDQFAVLQPDQKISPPSTTMALFSEDNDIYIGDAHSQSLCIFDDELRMIRRAKIAEGAVWMNEMEETLGLTVMGSFSPTDEKLGFVIDIPKNAGGQSLITAIDLRRPVHSSYGDLDGDGRTDIVVSEFGKWLGQLSIHWQESNGSYTPGTLLRQTGAIRSYIHDFDNDGLNDVIALFGQGNECIYIFYNQGNRAFHKEQVLQFSPSNGSTSFTLEDFDDDGHMDIVYTAGDNADFKPILKPYHGTYVFLNDGQNSFKQSLFLPLNGAYGAEVHDFDMDGDKDIAVISFFPDYVHHPEQSFVYYENVGNMTYEARTFERSDRGRWIVMDKKDYDLDGDQDIIIGSLAFEVVPPTGHLQKHIENGIPFLLLKNRAK